MGEGRWRVEGRGAFAEPIDVIDCGNAGTGVRLIMGAAAGFELAATFTGDASLRGRPMNRVLKPLGEMGATWLCREGGRLPLTLHGGNLSTQELAGFLAQDHWFRKWPGSGSPQNGMGP